MLFASLSGAFSLHPLFAQVSESDLAPPVETPPPPPSSDTIAAPVQPEEQSLPEPLPPEPKDPLLAIGDLRRAVRALPSNVAARLQLAESLYRIGDLDSALDECRMALKLQPHNVQTHIELSIILMAKQDWPGAATVLMETLQLDPKSTQAHYNLGSVQYALGNLPAAIQSYRRALDLQPTFLDARYRLALILKLANRHQESAQFMEEAAVGGIPQAQYFTGNAYRSGQGVKKNQALAIHWWAKAAELEHLRAIDALSQLRRHALSPSQTESRRKEALEAFSQYRELLWTGYPQIVRSNPKTSLGVALLKDNQVPQGVAVLFDEALALHESAYDELARFYEIGLVPTLAQFDPRILACFETLAADGYIPAKRTLARIYGKGLGVTREIYKAKAILKGLPKQDIQAIMDEIAER
jgi:TPR repeat protein